MTANRARLIALVTLVVVATWSPAGGQPAGRVPRLGVVLFETPTTNSNLPAFLAGLRDLGYVDGRNLAIAYRYADGRPERIREVALEAVALKPDVLVVLGGDMVPFVKTASGAIPIVMLTSNDPVEAGMVASFARPGGNVTGVAFVSAETAGKRLQFLKEAAPSITRVAVLWTPDHPDGEYRSAEAAARQLGVQVQSLEVRRVEEFDGAFDAAVRARAEALMVVSSRFMNLNRARILEAAGRHRLPVVSGWGPWVRAGGLMSYGPDLDTLVRRAATHVDRILRGARPADMPIEQPDRFELVINMRTARAFGLTVPSSLLGRADRVIE